MSFTVQLQNEIKVVASGSEACTLAMASVKAPDLAEDGENRAPMELVAVVDRSGSMSGEKIKLMKKTLQFMVEKGLNSGDSFSIVAYDNHVETRLSRTLMDAAGKKEALEVIKKLQTGGATNLSGGLLQGVDIIAQSNNQNATKAVMLFTDGLANNGITSTEGIVNAMSGVLQGNACSTFTFGFGADHSEDMLRGIADAGQGLYYYIEGADTIPQAFADCLGGLVSVVGQNASLTLTCQDGVQLKAVMGTYKTELNGAGTEAVIQLGDLYAEDEKDILVQVQWPALAEPGTSSMQLAHRCFNVLTSSMETQTATLSLERPAEAPASNPINPRLDVQRNRVRTAEAQAEASRLADAGEIEKGGKVLRAAVEQIQASPTAADELSQTLVADLERLQTGFTSTERYRSYGSKMNKMSLMSNMQQRCTHSVGGAYEKKSKKAMKSAFQTPLPEEEEEEDEPCTLSLSPRPQMQRRVRMQRPQAVTQRPQALAPQAATAAKPPPAKPPPAKPPPAKPPSPPTSARDKGPSKPSKASALSSAASLADFRANAPLRSRNGPAAAPKPATGLKPPARWFWANDSGKGVQDVWVEYSSELSKQLEQSYASGGADIRVDDERFVDLSSMLQRRYDDPTKRRKVCRHTDASSPPPTPQKVVKTKIATKALKKAPTSKVAMN